MSSGEAKKTTGQSDNIDYSIKTEIFEGPLDLLLHLVKTSEIDIYDIEISFITQEYLKYLSLLIFLEIDNISEFVDMATTLLLIKSRALLPVEVEFDEDTIETRENLISKLLEYQKYKIAAGILENKTDENIPLVHRNNEPGLFKIEETTDENWKKLTVLDLIEAFAQVLNDSRNSTIDFQVVVQNFTVEEKIKDINSMIKNKQNLNFFEVIKEKMTKLELVCIFLALLELVKKGIIGIKQHIIFGDINLFKKRLLTEDELNQLS